MTQPPDPSTEQTQTSDFSATGNYGPPPGSASPGYGAPGGQAYQAPPPQGYAPPPDQGYTPMPPANIADYGYPQQAAAVPPGFYYDQMSGLTLPQGTELATVGRRIGAYFLSILLFIVTLGIGWMIWGLIAWGKGQGPAYQVLGLRAYRYQDRQVATWGVMALREVVGRFCEGIFFGIPGIVGFFIMLSTKERRCLHDMIATTVAVYDPNKVLDPDQPQPVG